MIYAIRMHEKRNADDLLQASVIYSMSGPEGPWHDMVTGHYEWCEEVLDSLIYVANSKLIRHEDN